MKKKAVEAARIEYNRTAESLANLMASNDFASIEKHWIAFLGSAGRIFNKLAHGSLESGKSGAWFGRKKHERRIDPLLSYVWHARNAEEHTIQEIAQQIDTSVKFVEPTEENNAALQQAMKNEKRPWIPLALTEVVFAHVVVIDVIDSGVVFAVPRMHLGMPITNMTSANVGQLALAYLDAMITEADNLTA
jgi:hypothetical protein